jgi:hypothetical protein
MLAFGLFQQRMINLIAERGGQFPHQFANLQCIRLGANRALQRFLKLRRGDHLHRLGDFLDVANRLAAFNNRACLGHLRRLLRKDRHYEGKRREFKPGCGRAKFE